MEVLKWQDNGGMLQNGDIGALLKIQAYFPPPPPAYIPALNDKRSDKRSSFRYQRGDEEKMWMFTQ